MRKELKTNELKTFEVLTVCQQLVLTVFRYPNLTETTMGRTKEKIPPPLGLDDATKLTPASKDLDKSS